MTVKPNASHHAKTNPALSRIWSSHIFKQRVQTVEMRVKLPLVDKRNTLFKCKRNLQILYYCFRSNGMSLSPLSLLGSPQSHLSTCLQLMSRLRCELKRDSKTGCTGITYDKKHSKLLSCESVSCRVSKNCCIGQKSSTTKLPYKRPLSEERLE